MDSRETLSYIAGFFDGEGCVGIKRCGNTHQLYVSIGQNRPQVLHQIKSLFGGSVRVKGDIFIYWASAKKAKALLLAIRPFCIVKRVEIDLALEAFPDISFPKKLGVPPKIRQLREANKRAIETVRKIEIVNYSTSWN